ncbi:ATP-binding protein [Halopiger xanaduensis]|uniref:Adenosinetriphosphatase n=1 Tax=Halopiger xanaduensis (strain DSM 18323 / JCM 14033 / SH-6) TaxID=797210 RepID=F8D8I9_HALXS|nr:AAA family ATPase [Halopiger xanaduensis]AEH35617.1 Adenosinetriphosphatase [Halopiger xanaduensis SH-6]
MSSLVYATVREELDSGQYTVELSTGGIFDIVTKADLSAGDMIKLNGDDLTFEGMAKPDSIERSELGTVKKQLDGAAIVEINGVTQKIPNPRNINVEPGAAVEISRNMIVDVHPGIDPSLSLFGPDNESLINSFKESRSSGQDGDEEKELTFKDFGGMTTPQEQFRERVELFLTESDALSTVGTEPRMGALFYGPPGTGKTHFARILSESISAQFYRIRGPEIVSKGVGDTERLIREIFDDAREESPSIIFFDEIDSIAVDRGGEGTRDFSQRIVAQLLAVLDGFDGAQENVFVIAATNQINEIDDALLRPGRFDWQVHFPRPSDEHRREIFNTLREGYNLSDTITEENIDQVMSRTEGWTGAKLRALLNEAGVLCVAAGRDEIRHSDLLKAHERLMMQMNTNGGE